MFVLALAPLASLVVRAFGVFGTGLGANPIAMVTDTLGLWGLRLLLVTLSLTPLRHATGSSDWLRFRRMLGLFAFCYLLLHFTMYVAVDQSFNVGILVEDLMRRPWITLGFTALLLLVPLALTSTRAAMRRLGRRWQQLHYAIYPAALLGCWHYYWQVKRDVRSPLLYAAIFAVLMAARIWRKRAALAQRLTATSAAHEAR
ncbi:MAG TPA: protein-methionine-sulfoxide reductase heme-binding subunit MsrQ [Steroidobacteraceae bacterium]|nr:protein-methionine-sulfoxide reductase heme-binding subunit MsrQ [Steroidobacteraceae bacterium]